MCRLNDALIPAPGSRNPYVTASVVRAPVAECYPSALADLLTSLSAAGSLPDMPDVRFSAIKGPWLRQLPILPATSASESESRARKRGFLISSCHQDVWKLTWTDRRRFFPPTPVWLQYLELPSGLSTGGVMYLFYAREAFWTPQGKPRPT